MKMYRYEYSEFRNEIKITDFEVEEKKAVYISKNRCRIHKDDLDYLINNDNLMFSLSNDKKEHFKELLIEKYENRLENLNNSIIFYKDLIKNVARL